MWKRVQNGTKASFRDPDGYFLTATEFHTYDGR